ncbi:unnamed protein product, partial [Prorocentrum cordatum]
ALQKTEEKEFQMAKGLASARLSGKVAVRVLTEAAGVAADGKAAETDKRSTSLWTLSRDEELFANIDGYGCEQHEKEELQKSGTE